MDHADATNLRRNLFENSQPFSSASGLEIMEACYIATRISEAADVAAAHRIGHPCEHNRNRIGFAKKCRHRRISRYEEHVGYARNEIGSCRTRAFSTFSGKTIINLQV